MFTVPAGSAATLSLPLSDVQSDDLGVREVVFTVETETGTSMGYTHTVPVEAGASAVTLVVPANLNGLGEGVSKALRIVRATIGMTDGTTVPYEFYYAVRLLDRLVLMENSFQTYPQAQLEAMDMPNLLGWGAGDDEARMPALIEAYRRLVRLAYTVNYAFDPFTQIAPPPGWGMGTPTLFRRTIRPEDWQTIDAATFASMPEIFRQALCRGQLTEANEIMAGDVVGSKRRDGIQSETIGESSMFFRPGKPLDIGISAATLKVLGGFVAYRITMTRS